MSTPYLDSGRSAQKWRTREALVESARELVRAGETPTVERAAERASVSRTTAYRYFVNQRELLLAAHPETGVGSMLGADPPADAADRLAEVISRFTRLIVDTEAAQRTMLRVSLETGSDDGQPLPLRQGRAISWIAEALTPLEDVLAPAEVERLVLAIRSCTGIEALVWLTDVAGLTSTEAAETMQWSARSLLYAATTAGPPPVRPGERG
ncbi:MAG: TetR/AcrR family transcriptional regulator [Actinomycetota bacterium]|nr:TetR/AcrR family transcriptional regulator [Actinomycetota bacterium]